MVRDTVDGAGWQYNTVIAVNKTSPDQNFVIIPSTKSETFFIKAKITSPGIFSTSNKSRLTPEQKETYKWLKSQNAFNIGWQK